MAGTPTFSASDTPACRRSQGRRASGEACWAGERGCAGLLADDAVGAVLDEPAACGEEEVPPVGCGAVPLEVVAEHLDQDRRDEDGPGFVLGAVLEAAGLAGGAVVGPVLAGSGQRRGPGRYGPAAAREPAVGLFQHDGFGGAQVSVADVPVVARGHSAGAETKIVRNVDRRRNRRQTSAVGTHRESARPTCHPIIWRQSDDALTGDHRLPNRRSSRLMASAQYRCDGADQGLTRSAAPGP